MVHRFEDAVNGTAHLFDVLEAAVRADLDLEPGKTVTLSAGPVQLDLTVHTAQGR